MNLNKSSTHMLDVQNLTKKFGDVLAVKNLSFQVNKGEVFGFLGPNGAGKSTTMRIITCYIPATSGSIKVSGLDYIEDTYQIRKMIGYLPETTPLYPDMLVHEYLRFVGTIRGFKGQLLQTAVEKMVNLCGLEKMWARHVGHLSKGYRQRVGLAQAMIHDPDLLILDEPMSGLDPNQIVEIRQLIKQIGREKTVIYSSHILSEVSQTCTRILIINEGSIVALGEPETLVNQSSKNIYKAKIKGEKSQISQAYCSIPGVLSAIVDSADNNYLNIIINAENNAGDISEAIFKKTVDQSWMLLELKQEKTSLEDIFTQLTRN